MLPEDLASIRDENLAHAPTPGLFPGARMLFEKVDIWSVNHSRLLHLFTQI
jgi:hypothetical protein